MHLLSGCHDQFFACVVLSLIPCGKHSHYRVHLHDSEGYNLMFQSSDLAFFIHRGRGGRGVSTMLSSMCGFCECAFGV